MDTIILKFGGSSVADNDKLKLVASKIIKLYNKKNKIVVVVSAQGKTTDTLIKEAKQLSENPNSREMDVLLSAGEQLSMAKLSILLNELGYKAISLTGWQAGIKTDSMNQEASIKEIKVKRITEELEKGNIVIVAGFQGINEKGDITTLGRGGSDTTATSLAAALNTKECYIYSDVDGIYSADPSKVKNAKKIDNISSEEMINISSEGAKVLHNRCVEIAEKFNIPIIAKSTFIENNGTIIQNGIEEFTIKNIVKKEISRISIIGYGINTNSKVLNKVIEISEKNNLEILDLDISRSKLSINFKTIISDELLNEFHDKIILTK